MPTPDDQRQRGAQIQTSQSRVGPSVQKTATSSPFAGGGAGGQTPTQLQIGQQGQIKDAGTGLFDAISGTARGVQQGINNYNQYYDMVSKIEYSEFQTAYAQQRDLVNGDPKKMAAWLENNSYVPNRVTANAYWNLHADVNQKSYEQDQDDQLLQFEKRISSLQTPEQLNEISQQMKKLDPDSRFYKALELQEIKLGQRQAAVNRKAMVNGIRAENAIKNESLVASIKAAHGDKYNMFLSSEAFQQVLIAQSFGLAGVDAANGTITVGDNISYRMDSFPTMEVMPGLLDEISKRTEDEGLDIFEAHYSAANLPRGLMGNSARYTPSEAEKAVADKRMNDAISGSNPRDVLVMAGQAYPSDPQKGLVGFFDGMITQSEKDKLENMTPEELTRLTQTLDGAINLLDPENTEAFSVIAGPNDSAESVRNLYAGRMKQLVAARQSVTNAFVTRGVTGILEKSSEALSSDELASSSTLSLAGMRPHIASLTGDVDLHFVTPDGNHMMIPSTELGKTPTDGLIFAGMQYRDQEVLEDSLGISSKLPASVIMAQEMVKRTNQITGLVEGRVDVTPELTQDLIGRLTKRSKDDPAGSAQTLKRAVIANRDRTTPLLNSSADTVGAIRDFAATLPGDATRTDFTAPSQSRTVLYDIYRNGSKEDREALLKFVNEGNNPVVNYLFEFGVGMGVGEDFDADNAIAMFSAINGNPNFGAVGQTIDQYLEGIGQPVDSRRSYQREEYGAIDAMLIEEWNRDYPNHVDDPNLFESYKVSRLQQLKVAERALSSNKDSTLYAADPRTPRNTLERIIIAAQESPFAQRGMSDPKALPGPTNEMTSPAFQALGELKRNLEGDDLAPQVKSVLIRKLAPQTSTNLGQLIGEDVELLSKIYDIAASSESAKDKTKKISVLLKTPMEGVKGARPAMFARQFLKDIDSSPAIRFTPHFTATDNRMHSDENGVPIGQTSNAIYVFDFDLEGLEPKTKKDVRRAIGRNEITRLAVVTPGLAYTPLSDFASAEVQDKAFEATVRGVENVPSVEAQNESTRSKLDAQIESAKDKLAEYKSMNINSDAMISNIRRAEEQIATLENARSTYTEN
jgi:hypothetical protein